MESIPLLSPPSFRAYEWMFLLTTEKVENVELNRRQYFGNAFLIHLLLQLTVTDH